MATTYEKIATVTVGAGGAASMSFTSIPGTFTDLVVKWSGRTNTGGTVEATSVTFNGSSTYSTRYIQGDGSGVTSGAPSALNWGVADSAGATASTFGNSEAYIPNYTGSQQKSTSADSVQENNTSQGFGFLGAGLSTLTSAITSITITPNGGGSFVQYSSATLYGIKNS